MVKFYYLAHVVDINLDDFDIHLKEVVKHNYILLLYYDKIGSA